MFAHLFPTEAVTSVQGEGSTKPDNKNYVKGVGLNDLMSFLYVHPFAGVKISVSGDTFLVEILVIFYAAHGIMIKGI